MTHPVGAVLTACRESICGSVARPSLLLVDADRIGGEWLLDAGAVAAVLPVFDLRRP